MKAKLFLAALSLSAAACSTAPMSETGPAPAAQTTTSAAAVNPVGRYEFATAVQGQPVTGTITITGNPGAYGGEITTSVTPPLPISGATASGQQVTVTGNTPDGALTFRMNFTDGTNFSGAWELSGDSGNLTGRRLP